MCFFCTSGPSSIFVFLSLLKHSCVSMVRFWEKLSAESIKMTLGFLVGFSKNWKSILLFSSRLISVVYAGIKVDKNEEEILSLPPDHAVFPKIDIEDFETEMEKCMIKCHWEAKNTHRNIESKKGCRRSI